MAPSMHEASTRPTNYRRVCTAPRKDGQPCQAPVFGDASVCFGHDPERQAERAEARRRGGQGRSAAARLGRLMPPRLAPVFDRLAATLDAVLIGRLTPQQGVAVASISRAMVAVLQVAEIEQRLRDLEARDDDTR